MYCKDLHFIDLLQFAMELSILVCVAGNCVLWQGSLTFAVEPMAHPKSMYTKDRVGSDELSCVRSYISF